MYDIVLLHQKYLCNFTFIILGFRIQKFIYGTIFFVDDNGYIRKLHVSLRVSLNGIQNDVHLKEITY